MGSFLYNLVNFIFKALSLMLENYGLKKKILEKDEEENLESFLSGKIQSMVLFFLII